MKNLKTICLLAFLCLFALNISAAGTVKQKAAELLALAEANNSGVVYSGDGQVHTITPSSIGWASDNIAATDSWKLHMSVDATTAFASQAGYNSNGSTLLASTADAGANNPGDNTFKLYLTHPNQAASSVFKYMDYLGGAVNNSNSFSKSGAKVIDVIIFYDGNGHLKCTPTIDGAEQTPYICNVTLNAITNFSYALPAGISITDIDISPYTVSSMYAEPKAGSTKGDVPQSFSAAYVKTFNAKVGSANATEIYNVSSWSNNATSFFVLVPTAVTAKPGDTVKLTWTGKDLKNTRLSAFADLNADYQFTTTSPDVTGAIGSFEAWKNNDSPNNDAVVSGDFTFTIPNDMKSGTQFRVRLRFDCKWTNSNSLSNWEGKVNTYPTTTTGVVPADDYMYRPVYDIVINVVEDFPMNGKYCRIRAVNGNRNVNKVWCAEPIAAASIAEASPNLNANANVNLYDPSNAAYQSNMIWAFEHTTNGYKIRHANSQALVNDYSTIDANITNVPVALNADQTTTGTFSFVNQNSQVGGKQVYMLQYIKPDGTESKRYVNKRDGGITEMTWWTGGTDNGNDDFVFDEVTSVPVSFATSVDNYITLCLPFAVSVPTGVKAYYVEAVGTTNFKYVELTGGKIPAFTGVILKADNVRTYDFPILYENVPAISNNALVGVTCKTVNIPAGSILTLGKSGSIGAGMYLTSAATAMGYNTAYLPKPATYADSGQPFVAVDYNGSYNFKCDSGTHDWNLIYNAIGTTATIEGLSQPAGAGSCTGGCSVTLPGEIKGAYTVAGTGQQVDVTIVQVGTTIAQDVPTLKKLTLPSTVENIMRSRVTDISNSAFPLELADIPNGITGTHAGEGTAWKWEVSPTIKGLEEWWFVGEFDFPKTLSSAFENWGCALLTSRKWPSQEGDNWTSRFQIWVNGKQGIGRVQGDIRLVNDYNSANVVDSFLYFKDEVGKNINVLGKTVRFEVHNYPEENGSTTLIYTVKTYDTATYTSTSTPIQEGRITTTVSNFSNIDWLSNYVPTEVNKRSLKFYRPETKMITYQDGASVSDDTAPITNGKMTLTKVLTNKESWITAVTYKPESVGVGKTILASNGNDGNNAVSDGFRITQNANNTFSLSAQNNTYTFPGVVVQKDYPYTFTLYHIGNDIKVSIADLINMKNVEAAGTAKITADITSMKTGATYADNKFSVTVGGQEHMLFANCPHLEEIVLQNQNLYKSIDGAVYDENAYTLVRWPEGKTHSDYTADEAAKTVKASTYNYNEPEVTLPSTVKRIGQMAFFNCQNPTTVLVDNIDEIERLSRVKSEVTYETTPAHFLSMKKNDHVSFRLNLMQETANVANLNAIAPLTYAQIAMPDRFASANSSTWYTFTVPFDVTAAEVAENFSPFRKLDRASISFENENRKLTIVFEDAQTIEAGVPYIAKVNNNILQAPTANGNGQHSGELRFSYREFKTGLNDITLAKAFDATDADYDYHVSMHGNIDPENISGTDSNEKTADGYKYTYIVSSNQLKQVTVGKTSKNKGYRGWLDILAKPNKDNAASAPIMEFYLNAEGEATGIVEVKKEDSKEATVYNLSGCMLGKSLDKLPAGVYIINNKKVVKR
ncbi:MAG: hypothetical protein HUK05_00020 [Prevotella sp.]|nr:hypothetical protein [Prevotella sp.]